MLKELIKEILKEEISGSVKKESKNLNEKYYGKNVMVRTYW